MLTRARGWLSRAVPRVARRRRLANQVERRSRRLEVLQHNTGRRQVAAAGVVVQDKAATREDIAIAGRLIRAFRAATQGHDPTRSPEQRDLWTDIASRQTRFTSILRNGDDEELAQYLCNVSRQDAAIGITQGDEEYARILSDPAYRHFLAVMAKDKLVSLAEAVGSLPLENPEQGEFAVHLHASSDEIVAGISQKLGIDIAPPDIDGGMFKLATEHGLFSERDANAIFTAWLLKRAMRGLDAPRICEIGAGSGRVAYWSHRLGAVSYTIVDLPRVNVVQGYYLLKSLPADRVRLYGEEPASPSPLLTIWPDCALHQLPEARYDVVVNQDSMPEMSRAIVDEYLCWIRKSCQRLFVSINHENSSAYTQQLKHVNVPGAVAAIGGFELQDRYPYWLRQGYVVELYRVSGSG